MLVDPLDTDALSRALALMVQDDAAAARLVTAGRRRAAAFAPEAFAERLRALCTRTTQR